MLILQDFNVLYMCENDNIEDPLTQKEREQLREADEFIENQNFESIDVESLKDKLSTKRRESLNFF